MIFIVSPYKCQPQFPSLVFHIKARSTGLQIVVTHFRESSWQKLVKIRFLLWVFNFYGPTLLISTYHESSVISLPIQNKVTKKKCPYIFFRFSIM